MLLESDSLVALELVRVQKLSVADFNHFLDTMSLFQAAVLRHLVRLVRFQSWRQEILALHNVSGAVAAQLLLIAHQYGQVQEDNSLLGVASRNGKNRPFSGSSGKFAVL